MVAEVITRMLAVAVVAAVILAQSDKWSLLQGSTLLRLAVVAVLVLPEGSPLSVILLPGLVEVLVEQETMTLILVVLVVREALVEEAARMEEAHLKEMVKLAVAMVQTAVIVQTVKEVLDRGTILGSLEKRILNFTQEEAAVVLVIMLLRALEAQVEQEVILIQPRVEA